MKEYVKEYKNYVIRKLGRYFVAIPKDAICYGHKMIVGESNEFAFKSLTKIIGDNKL